MPESHHKGASDRPQRGTVKRGRWRGALFVKNVRVIQDEGRVDILDSARPRRAPGRVLPSQGGRAPAGRLGPRAQ